MSEIKKRKKIKQAFVIFDSETTKRNGMVFDAGWQTVTRAGTILGEGSYLFKDILTQDNPFYREKIANYWKMAYDRDVRPTTFAAFRRLFNWHLRWLIYEKKMEPIFCAYNASFDTRVVSKTSMVMIGKPFLMHKIRLLDIWDAWAVSCPKNYVAEISPAGNIRSRAEDVFAFEMKQPGFIEDHTAHSDSKIEAEILLKVLSRKKRLPIVEHPSQFNAQPWRTVQERVNVQKLLAKVEA